MSIVADIFTSIQSKVAADLPSSYRKLRRVIDLDESDLKAALNGGWGVRHGAAGPADGILKAVTLDQTFEVVLSKCFVDKLDDDAKQDAVNELHTNFESIYCDLVNTKAGVPLNVLLVDQPSIADPEYFDATVALVCSFVVKFRKPL